MFWKQLALLQARYFDPQAGEVAFSLKDGISNQDLGAGGWPICGPKSLGNRHSLPASLWPFASSPTSFLQGLQIPWVIITCSW